MVEKSGVEKFIIEKSEVEKLLLTLRMKSPQLKFGDEKSEFEMSCNQCIGSIKLGEIRIAPGEISSARVMLLSIAEHTWVYISSKLKFSHSSSRF